MKGFQLGWKLRGKKPKENKVVMPKEKLITVTITDDAIAYMIEHMKHCSAIKLPAMLKGNECLITQTGPFTQLKTFDYMAARLDVMENLMRRIITNTYLEPRVVKMRLAINIPGRMSKGDMLELIKETFPEVK